METILLIDADDQVRKFIQVALEGAGYRVLRAAGGKEGVRLLHDQVVDAILVDIVMPDMDGLELIQRLRTTRPTSKIILMSGGSGEWNYLNVAQYLGANAPLKKPFGPQDLLDAVSSQLK